MNKILLFSAKLSLLQINNFLTFNQLFNRLYLGKFEPYNFFKLYSSQFSSQFPIQRIFSNQVVIETNQKAYANRQEQ